jgi:hypothetical protein
MNLDFGEENNATGNLFPNPKKHKNPSEAAQSVSDENRSGQQESGAQNAQKFEKRHKTTRIPNTLTFFPKENQNGQHHQKDSAPKQQSFTENANGLSSLYKTEYLDDVEFEDLPMPKDLFGGCHSATRAEGSLSEGKKMPPDGIGKDLAMEEDEENDLLQLGAAMVDLGDSMTLANGSDDSTRYKDDMDILGDTQSSSKPLDNLSSSKPQSTAASRTLDIEDDMGFFETPLAHVVPQNLRKGSNYDNDSDPLEFSRNSKEPAQKDPVTSGNSGRTVKTMRPRDGLDHGQAVSTIGVFGDGLGLNTPLAKRMESSLNTPHGNGAPFTSLRDITNQYSRLKDIQNIRGKENGPENERGAKKLKGETYEEKQKRLWADVDPTIYEEFHDMVELVDD